ncbi:MarR family winged helix-turn-helix transcriptional regulator [Pseudomonas sp. RIT-To-2]|uniref:MarR family winged helix-turn-helix transcriptional regulator n=1 Tax=Pseudomonas sp. RIT-To-2 TaxID=3462541 RepID=UPI002412EE7E
MYSDFLNFKLDMASALLMEQADAVYRQHWDLDVRGLRVLRLIQAYPDITPKEVSARALLEKTLLSKTLSLLESRELISRHAHPVDRRSVGLRTTAMGAQVADDSSTVGAELEDRLVGALSQQERETLDALISKLVCSLLAPT